MKRFLLLFAILCFINSCGTPDIASKLERELRRDLAHLKAGGVAATVFNADSALFIFNYGHADEATLRHIDEHTPFLLASITKVFTAIGVLQLYQNGKIHLDSAFICYVPEFELSGHSGNADNFTIRDLLTHQAGLPSDFLLHKYSLTPRKYDEILNHTHLLHAPFTPQTISHYSNVGYHLLGLLIERITGNSYESYIKNQILDPAAMGQTTFFVSPDDTSFFARPYFADGRKGKSFLLFDGPAGNIISTAHDMMLFGQALLKNEGILLADSLVNQMFSVQNMQVALDLDDRKGFGFYFGNTASELGLVPEHGGGDLFFRTEFYLSPETGLGGVWLSNVQNGKNNAWKLKEMGMMAFARERGLLPESPFNPPKLVRAMKIADASEFSGYYTGLFPLFKIQVDHDGLQFLIEGGQENVNMLNDTTFTLRNGKKFILSKVNDAHLLVEWHPWNDLGISAVKIEPQQIDSIWHARLGKYQLESLAPDDFSMVTNAELVINEGFLALKYHMSEEIAFGQESIVLMRILDDFRLKGFSYERYQTDVLEFMHGEVNRFNLMGLTFKKIE